ncbi:MAG: enoyl-CoA hydratase [Rhizobiales bacterium 68-8]|nr:MAG: enoyl-CoA hydratase [Rhizobiales bacterium 68-8]
MYESYTGLKFERRGRILVISIDNPPTNPMTPAMHTELSRVFTDINRDAETSVVVLTGAGDAFSSGGNIRNMVRRIEENRVGEWYQGIEEARQILRGVLRLEKPLITRINGHAMGLGATLAVAGDISYMLEDARIADTHVRMGLVAGDGGALLWPLLMGFTRARRYLLTGDSLTGREAAELGLVTESCTAAELDGKGFGMAERLAEGSAPAISGTKIAINALLRAQLEMLIDTHLALETQTFFSPDHSEAAHAFMEKRKPKFGGK